MGRPDDDTGDAVTIARDVARAPSSSLEPVTDATLPASRESSPGLEDLAPGFTIGRYRLVERLGAGAMGVVWSAQDPRLDRRIAIKVVHPSLARSPEASARLLREARAMAKLSHRAVVTVHDAGEVDGRLFLGMELVDGTTLGHMLRTRSAASLADWPRWLGMMLDAGRGLAAAHDAGVLHRDFKPDNILVDNSGRVCVADFGLATLGDERHGTPTPRAGSHGALELTTTGALLGTPIYMSPQQLRGEVIDARADQFNFCVATWEALYGARPYAVHSQGLEAIAELDATIVAGVLPPPPPDSPVPPEIRAALTHGLAADPEARWPNMNALIGALE
nr:serine/threonine protein kinase [Myxococcota bacterium]